MVALWGAALSLLLTGLGVWWARHRLSASPSWQVVASCLVAAALLGGLLTPLQTGWPNQLNGAAVVAALIVLLLINLRTQEIPNVLVGALALVGVVTRLYSPMDLWDALPGAVAGFLPPALLLLTRSEVIGIGTWRLVTVLGLTLYWPGIWLAQLTAAMLAVGHILASLWQSRDLSGRSLPVVPYVATATLVQMVIDARHLVSPGLQWRITGSLLVIFLALNWASHRWLRRKAPPTPDDGPFRFGSASPDDRWLVVFEENGACATLSLYEQGVGLQDALRLYDRVQPPLRERQAGIFWSPESTYAVLAVDRECWAVFDLTTARKCAQHLAGGIPWDQAERGVRPHEGEPIRFWSGRVAGDPDAG